MYGIEYSPETESGACAETGERERELKMAYGAPRGGAITFHCRRSSEKKAKARGKP